MIFIYLINAFYNFKLFNFMISTIFNYLINDFYDF